MPCSFRDIDCGVNGICQNIFNDFSCSCGDGARKTVENDPKSACLIDNCYNIDCERGECEASLNSYSCSCDVGAMKKNETNPKSMCIIDYCYNVDCNRGSCEATLNDYTCECDLGRDNSFL